MRKGLFFSDRDIQLFKRVSNELVQRWMNVEVLYFKLNIGQIEVNIYGEAKSGSKQYAPGIKIPALVQHQPKSLDYTNTIQAQNTTIFKFLTTTLTSKNIYPQQGDIIKWDNSFWEVSLVTDEQLIANDESTKWSRVCTANLISLSKARQLLKFIEEADLQYLGK